MKSMRVLLVMMSLSVALIMTGVWFPLRTIWKILSALGMVSKSGVRDTDAFLALMGNDLHVALIGCLMVVAGAVWTAICLVVLSKVRVAEPDTLKLRAFPAAGTGE